MSLLLLLKPGSTAAQISGTSTCAATGSLSLAAGPSLSLTSTATATGTLTLDSGSVGGIVAAPGWLGIFVRTTAVNTALIAGTSDVTATGSLSLQVPTSALISSAVVSHATGTLLLAASTHNIILNTTLTSSQEGSTTMASTVAGSTTVTTYDYTVIS